MPVLPPHPSAFDEASIHPPIPFHYSIVNSIADNSTSNPLLILIIASATIFAILVYWHKRRRSHFGMPQYPSALEKSFGRSSPPPSAPLKLYSPHHPSPQSQNYGNDPPPPAPTIRRQSEPSEPLEPSRIEMAESQNGASSSPEAVFDGPRPIKLPPPSIPGRTDTIVTLNGCRRHMMVIEGQPFRRGTA
ncbi:hypothetical protein MMC18_002743 [Xylographa bjoerkii]|nr:hypothetical protein [Xylographa bjoerkii]